MKNRIISIATPCTENWDIMTPSEKGRFCAKCKKEVVDFTKMTTDQVVDSLTKKSEQSICGLLRKDQTEKPKSKVHLFFAHLNISAARLFILMAISAVFSLTGCGSVKNEFKEFKNTLFPPNPPVVHHDTVMGILIPAHDLKTQKEPGVKGEIDFSEK